MIVIDEIDIWTDPNWADLSLAQLNRLNRLNRDDVDAWVREQLDKAPPLSEATRVKVAGLLAAARLRTVPRAGSLASPAPSASRRRSPAAG